MNQHFNSVQFFKCNDLVTENCLFVSLIDFRLSKLYHYITKVHFFAHSSKSQSHLMFLLYSIITSENRFFITFQKKPQVTVRISALTTISRNQGIKNATGETDNAGHLSIGFKPFQASVNSRINTQEENIYTTTIKDIKFNYKHNKGLRNLASSILQYKHCRLLDFYLSILLYDFQHIHNIPFLLIRLLCEFISVPLKWDELNN